MQEELFIKFAEFEEKVKEVERARAIFRCPPALCPTEPSFMPLYTYIWPCPSPDPVIIGDVEETTEKTGTIRI